ncbi:MAG: hypothetical protein LT102_04305 [Burkholderiaceae bacterium]|nr:hypothetical protein [Burkholderiaceae bacterium]
MRRLLRLALALLALLPIAQVNADAAPQVHVLETWPAGERITLARNQNFYLRLAYASDTPVGIWVKPYFRGKPANAGTSPSLRLSGEGEVLGWFFLMEPGVEVDEIHITAGDGGLRSTPVVATVRVHIVGGSATASADTPPTWVTELGERATVAARQAREAQSATPSDPGDTLLLGGFMIGMLVVGLLGFVAPAWTFRRWRGGWRIAAAVPAIMMAFVVLRIVLGTARDPTSHNLWPFEILLAGVASTGAVVVLVVLHRFGAGAGQRR